MKNRYFGDIHDYFKYALLRQLTGSGGASTVVCWMLTEDDRGTGGKRTKYLEEPEKWNSFEPLVFDFLRNQVLERKVRTVQAIEKSDVLPNCRFYSRLLTDDSGQRQEYFDRFLGFARGAAFVFFDPDNGVEVKSVKYGRRNSSKYLYWNEIALTLGANHSLLIYQHLPLRPRSPFIDSLADILLEICRGGVVYAIRTSQVAFFLVPQRGCSRWFRKSLSDIEKRWDGVLVISEHRRS